MRATGVEPIDHPLVHVVAKHPVARLGELDRERKAHVTQADNAEDDIAPLDSFEERLGDLAAHALPSNWTGVPPAASDRLAASNTRITRTPSAASARGLASPRTTWAKCRSWAARGSALEIRGM